MEKIKLNRQKHNKPDFNELSRMISALNGFLDEEVNPQDSQWMENFNTIIDFQDPDGSFKLFDSYNIPSDAVVDFCFTPTYISTAVLMKAYLLHPEIFTSKEKTVLSKALEKSASKGLNGHGFEAFKGQTEALRIFMRAGVREFTDIHADLSEEFSQMISGICSRYMDMQIRAQYTGRWGESYEEDIKQINEYFSNRRVFVYGTLMKDESNHDYLQNASFAGNVAIEGYDMYDMGAYPAVVPGENLIVGELYTVPVEDMAIIDMLEGEGSLYVKKCERIKTSEGWDFALIYVYNREVSGYSKIPSWKPYVWYVSYGSNMLEERFLCYIRGGSFENSRCHPPCSDPTPPVAVRTVEIPYDMYFGNESRSWDGSGVSFLDTTRKGKSLGVAYLITPEQLKHVILYENSGRSQNREKGWYEDTIDLEAIDGFEVKTITNNDLRDYHRPFEPYLDTLRRGIRQHWPEMTDEEIEDYLENSKR